jgi:hypothetical protein
MDVRGMIKGLRGLFQLLLAHNLSGVTNCNADSIRLAPSVNSAIVIFNGGMKMMV